MNVFSVVTCGVFSYGCILHYFLTMPVAFNFNLTYGLKPQFSGIKIATVYRWSIFQVEWLIATLILFSSALIQMNECPLFTSNKLLNIWNYLDE